MTVTNIEGNNGRHTRNLSKAILIATLRQFTAEDDKYRTTKQLSVLTGLKYQYLRNRCRKFATWTPPILLERIIKQQRGRPAYGYHLASDRSVDHHWQKIRSRTRVEAMDFCRQHRMKRLRPVPVINWGTQYLNDLAARWNTATKEEQCEWRVARIKYLLAHHEVPDYQKQITILVTALRKAGIKVNLPGY